MVHLLNTTIMPTAGIWLCAPLTLAQAQALIAGQPTQSHVGHEAAAALLADLLGVPVAYDRTPWDGSGDALALKVAGRPPEGKILTQEEMMAAGVSLFYVQRMADVQVLACVGGDNEQP